ncbi:hypothetical protein EXT68_05650 [Pectobacterium parmentieri]|uniref:Membrane protein n=1 Tax=Pectobacterium parmentieri TaxID=1905730 RepID=A0A0H3I2Q4_PECPM|nr:Putative membrane protein [Pectobacterium parmentieri]MBI0472838.1 hypothetical protein [Pectobacterium parmentieri]MBI0495417.1 hypothetical protein [Pectobacterium parmentieri]MBI0556776.1 hypothetical protein [Pectobacterium parmentieri]MBI0569981.1 hypothetical protein [Pectobacterium parmentieri]
MSWLYFLFSTIAIFPLYLSVKKLTSSHFIYTRFSSILLPTFFMCFHLYIFHAGKISFIGISIEDNDFIFYSSFIFALLCAITSAVAHNRS